MPSYALALKSFHQQWGVSIWSSGAACPAGLEYRSSEKWFFTEFPQCY